jgi:hypothetical protein
MHTQELFQFIRMGNINMKIANPSAYIIQHTAYLLFRLPSRSSVQANYSAQTTFYRTVWPTEAGQRERLNRRLVIIKTLFTYGAHFTKCAFPWSRVH